jgi:hypothetical protein
MLARPCWLLIHSSLSLHFFKRTINFIILSTSWWTKVKIFY